MILSVVAWAETFTVRSAGLEITLEKTAAAPENAQSGTSLAVTGLLDRGTGHALFADGASDLFTLEVRKPGDSAATQLSSQSRWGNIKAKQESDGTLRLTFERPEELGTEASIAIHVTLAGSPDAPELRLAWSGEALSESWTLWRGKFPILPIRPFGEKMRAIYPMLSGIVRDNPFESNFTYRGIYPDGWSAAMGWCALWDDAAKHGLYFGAHDPDANLKVFAWNGKEGTQSLFTIDTPFENMGIGGNTFTEYGTFVLRLFDGDWYDAARIYKSWVFAEAAWRPELGPEGRPDVAPWMKENSVFLMASTDERWLTPNRRVYTPLGDMDKALREFSEAVGLPGAVHWYLWHQNPYDNDYPHFFPAKEGFAEEVRQVQETAHFRVMPYTNGRLWDTKDKGTEDWRFSAEGKAGALVREDGSIYTETYALPSSGKEADGSACVHAAMCPATEVWRKKVRENALTAMNVYGTTGVYIDQVGASAPFPCHSRLHGHPVGGGHWWLTEGYWKIFAEIRRDMRREVADIPFSPEVAEQVRNNPSLLNDRIFTTECNSEVYAHLIDGFLTWHWQDPLQVPAFPTVYGGTTPMFGRCSTGESLALQMRVSQALTWGEQIGWFDPSVCRDAAAFPFVRDAIRCRHALRRYFYTGEMLRAPEFTEPLPIITADWLWAGAPNTHHDPAIFASAWRIADFAKKEAGEEKTVSAVLIFSNVSEEEITRTVRVRLEELGLESGMFTIRRIDAESVSDPLPPDTLEKPIRFEPKKSFALELRPKGR